MTKKVSIKLSGVAAKVVGKRCISCDLFINQDEVENNDFIYNKLPGKRGNVFLHRHCFEREYGKKVIG